ncbi:MAG: hypothetical protein P4L27_05470 [Ignavibacteriaceae bacterium]|nr:hypothetical protein [Ignavibacteriaceae bacterium]
MNDLAIEQLNKEKLRKSINSQLLQGLYDADLALTSPLGKDLRAVTFTDQLASF